MLDESPPEAAVRIEPCKAIARHCLQCSEPFEALRPEAKFCSGKCRALYSKLKDREEAVRSYLREQARKGGLAKAAKMRARLGENQNG